MVRFIGDEKVPPLPGEVREALDQIVTVLGGGDAQTCRYRWMVTPSQEYLKTEMASGALPRSS